MDNVIGLKELRENIGNYAKLVQAGRSFIVMKRSKPLFTINPIEEDGWETVVDFTKLRKNGISANELIKRLKNM